MLPGPEAAAAASMASPSNKQGQHVRDDKEPRSPTRTVERQVADRTSASRLGVTPNVEATRGRRVDALPARCRIDSECLAGKVASRWHPG